MLFRELCMLAGLLHVQLASCAASPSSPDSIAPACSKYMTQIKAQLSPNSTLQCGGSDVRWSQYAQPNPGAIVSVGTEDDVAKLVSFASKYNIPFLTQSGANGWADTFKLGQDGFVIDVSKLKTITFNKDKTQATFQAGVTNADLINAAWDNNARASTATCNCVSVLGAALGGGLSRTQGLYGHGADQLLSVNFVDANGNKKTVTPKSDPDLWWALKGAGANFGIVTSAVFQTFPIPQANNTAWTGPLIFDQSKIEQVVSAINAINLEPEMEIDFYFTGLPPTFAPTVIALPFYVGDEATGRKKFDSILKLGPQVDGTQVIPYNTWNAAGDSFCVKGDRKPAYTTALKTMDPKAWRNIWNQFTSFTASNPETGNTTILAECYSTGKSLQIGSSQSSYPFRDIKCYAIAIPWYIDSSLDAAANKFGQGVRQQWAASAGTKNPSSYINFAHGDEPLSNIYGSSLPRLQSLKKRYDPQDRFNQWFDLSGR